MPSHTKKDSYNYQRLVSYDIKIKMQNDEIVGDWPQGGHMGLDKIPTTR